VSVIRYLLFVCSILLLIACENQSSSAVVGDYNVSELNIDFGNSDAYEIGANDKGMPIFKNTEKALAQAISDYQVGFEYLASEFNLEPVSHENYEMYKVYGWQTNVSDEMIKQQCIDITGFFDIYENSFK